MKKIILFLLLAPLFSLGQSLVGVQTIGQPTRNQATGNGLQVADTLLVLGKVWLPYLTTLGGATDSVLSKDPLTGIIELRPQSTGGGATDSNWHTLGNAGTVSGTNFIGTTDNVHLDFRTNDSIWMRLRNTGILNLRHGMDSVCVSCFTSAPMWDMKNIGIGDSAMAASNPYAADSLRNYLNLFVGTNSGKAGKALYGNVVSGHYTMEQDTGKISFVPLGAFPPAQAAAGNYENAGYGNFVFRYGTGFKENTAMGTGAMEGQDGVTRGASRNTAVGQASMNNITTAVDNVAVGRSSLAGITSGLYNVAIGNDAGLTCQSGQNNIFIGFEAGKAVGATQSTNYGIGKNALNNAGSTGGNGNFNIAYGSVAGSSVTEGQGNGFFGHGAGSFLTTENRWLIFDNFLYSGSDRGSFTGDTTHAIIVGQWGRGDVFNQSLRINAKFGVNNTHNVQKGQTLYLEDATNGYLQYTSMTNDTTSGDAATINSVLGRFKKDSSGATFTLTNNFITTNSHLDLTANNLNIDLTALSWTYFVPVAGTAVITFNAAPSADFKMVFKVEN